MSKKKSGPPKFLRHRVLVTAEAVLLISFVKDVITNLVKDAAVANAWKVLFVMASTVGLFGVLFVAMERFAASGVAKTHEAVQALPVPMPLLAIHATLMVGLFYLYAWHQALPVWPMVGAH